MLWMLLFDFNGGELGEESERLYSSSLISGAIFCVCELSQVVSSSSQQRRLMVLKILNIRLMFSFSTRKTIAAAKPLVAKTICLAGSKSLKLTVNDKTIITVIE